MWIEIGHFSVLIALLLTLLGGASALYALQRRDVHWAALALAAAPLAFLLILLGFLTLMAAFIADDFSEIGRAHV
mgnify:CR=1 FL=1